MAKRSGFYSKIIAWLKILLPLVALGLLSSLFLLSRKGTPEMRVPFSQALDGVDIGQEMVRGPTYAGTTKRGDTLTMTAATVTSMRDGSYLADDFTAVMTRPDGGRITADSLKANLREADDQVIMQGEVLIRDVAGYTLETDELTTAISRIAAESGGPVFGTGPNSTIEAGHMVLESIGESEDLLIDFSDGVRTVFQPQVDAD